MPAQQARQVKNDERSVRELASECGPNWREARVELAAAIRVPCGVLRVRADCGADRRAAPTRRVALPGR